MADHFPAGFLFAGLGSLLRMAAVLAVLGCAAVLIVSGMRRPRDRRLVFTGAALLGGLALMALAVWRTDVQEWNPVVPAAEMPGEWTAGDSRLRLMPDGAYDLRTEGAVLRRIGVRQSAGRWSLDDWNLSLADNAGPRIELRVVTVAGEFRIVDQPEDLDGWDRWDGLARVRETVEKR